MPEKPIHTLPGMFIASAVLGTGVALWFLMVLHLLCELFGWTWMRPKLVVPLFDMAHWPDSLPPIAEYAAGVRRRATIACTAFVQAPEDDSTAGPLDSWLGTVVAGARGESWPQADGRPMVGLCQLNLVDAPVVPESLTGVVMVTLFVAADANGSLKPFPQFDAVSPSDFLVRTYASLEDLVPYLDPPAPPAEFNPCAARREMFLDQPPWYAELAEARERMRLPETWTWAVHSAICQLSPPDVIDRHFDTKIGGWTWDPTQLFREPLVFQFGSHDKVIGTWAEYGPFCLWRNGDDWEMRSE